MAGDGKTRTGLLDQLESGPWPTFVKDRRPTELTTSGLRTKNLIRTFHLKNLVDVAMFRVHGSGVTRMAVEFPFHAGARTAAAQGEVMLADYELNRRKENG